MNDEQSRPKRFRGAQIRNKLLNNFRVELAEHIQTMTGGLLALEQSSPSELSAEQRQAILDDVFRAAHSLKGASRIVGATAIEQLAHALESVLSALQRKTLEQTAALFDACYQALDAIQATKTVYEAGQSVPPPQVLQALMDLEPFQTSASPIERVTNKEPDSDIAEGEPTTVEEDDPVETGGPPVSTAPAPTSSLLAGNETVRITVDKLDALMGQLGDLMVAKMRNEQGLTQLEQLQASLDLWHKECLQIRRVHGRFVRHKDIPHSIKRHRDWSRLLDYVQESQERLRQVSVQVGEFIRKYTDDAANASLIIDELEQEIKNANMLPLNTITTPFVRMVRDLAQAAGKEIKLQVMGGETELDRRVLQQIKDPLVHLLRNAIDHGIESPQVRLTAGKPRFGVITIKAEQLDKEVIICVSDDGAGLDIEAIRQIVAQRSQIDPQTLSENELVEAIFSLGVSTSPIITDISGRGVGLNVVQRNVEMLHGRIECQWTPGAGVTLCLILPVRLLNAQGLLVRVADESFVIPFRGIDRILEIYPEQIKQLEGHDVISYGEQPIRVVRLDAVLELPRLNEKQKLKRVPIVILQAAERRMAFIVDELLGEQDFVIKGLSEHLARVRGIAGSTVLGGGELVLILNVIDLIKLGLQSERRTALGVSSDIQASEAALAPRRILVVDDSITTRTLEKNILEVAGYIVELAINGQQALDIVTSGWMPDLIVSDVAMPKVDGFELTEQIKQDPRTSQVPVILVTSLASSEHKRRGIQVGADAYIVKSAFDQDILLETIQQLV